MCRWPPGPRLRDHRRRDGSRRRRRSRMASTASSEATSPALWPPMPSATTNRPPDASIRNASSLLASRPGVGHAMRGHTPLAPDYSRPHWRSPGSLAVYSDRGHLHGPGRARPGDVGARTRPGRRSRPDPAAPSPVRRAPSRGRARGPGALAEAWLLQDDLDAGRGGARPPARHAPRAHLRRAALDAVAAARPHRLRARRAVARHRAAHPRARSTPSSRTTRAPSASPTTSWPLLQAGRRLRHRPRAHDRGRRRRCTPPATGATSRSCTRCRACCSRSRAATTKPIAALRQAERLAMAIHADDVLAGIVHNQANVALIGTATSRRWRWPSAASRCTSRSGQGHGLAVALATLGQICVQLGDLERAEADADRALEVRSPIQFHETTGAVFDTLAQIHLMRGAYERAGEYLRQAGEAYGAYGTQTEALVRVVAAGARASSSRSGAAPTTKRSRSPTSSRTPPDVPPAEAHPGRPRRLRSAARRRPRRRGRAAADRRAKARLDPRDDAGQLGRVPAPARRCVHEQARQHPRRTTTSRRARTSSSCSASAIRRRSASSRSAGWPPTAGARHGRRAPSRPGRRRVPDARRAARSRRSRGGARRCSTRRRRRHRRLDRADADDAHRPAAGRRRGLARAAGARDRDRAARGDRRPTPPWSFVAPPAATLRVHRLRRLRRRRWRARWRARRPHGRRELAAACAARSSRSAATRRSALLRRRHRRARRTMPRCAALRMIAAVARQGFELCGARERPPQAVEPANERPLEPLLPGFICASAAMTASSSRFSGCRATT